MDDVDLSGVDPTNWTATRRRIAVLQAWIDGGQHTPAEEAAAARKLGVGVRRFRSLVSTWRNTRDAARVSNNTLRRGYQRPSHTLPVATREAIDEAIAALGPEARFSDIQMEAARRCAIAGTPTASSGRVHQLLMRQRQLASHKTAAGERGLLAARVFIRLPMIVDRRTIATPELLLAVMADNGAIVDHELNARGDLAEATRALMARVVGEAAAVAVTEVTIAGDLAALLDHDPVPGADPMRATVVRASRLLARLLGSHIGMLPICQNQRREPEEATWPPLPPADIERAARIAIEDHNASRTVANENELYR